MHHRRTLHLVVHWTLLEVVWRAELSRLVVHLPIHLPVHLVHLVHLIHLVHLVELLHLVHLVELLKMIELLERRVVVHASLHSSRRRRRCCHMLLVTASRVGIVVNTRMPRELV